MKVSKRSLLPPSFNLKMAAVGSPQMLINFYHTAWYHIPEYSTVYLACMSWNFKPYVQWHISERILVLVHYYEAIKHMLLQLTIVFWVYFIITYHLTCENSGFWCHIDDTFTLVKWYAACAGNCLVTFWDSLSALSLRIKQPNKNAVKQMFPWRPLGWSKHLSNSSGLSGQETKCHPYTRTSKEAWSRLP